MTDLNALKIANARLTHERLLQVLSYEPETGKFRRTAKAPGPIKIGQEAGWINPNGYRYIEVCGERFLAHRLAWFYMTGEWPSNEIDHKDCNRDNNSWVNLRAATRLQNLHNAKIKTMSSTGYKGVYFDKRYGKFVARIRHAGKRISLGYFDAAEDAHQAYAVKAAEFRGEFARSA